MLNGFYRACAAGVLALIGYSAGPAVAADATDWSGGGESIVQIAVSDPDLSTLVKALKDTNLVSTLEGAGPFTVFAPTNEAFGKLPAGLLNYLVANPSILKQVLLYHVAAGANTLTSAPLKTVEGELVFPSFSDGVAGTTVSVNNSLVTIKAIKASNGVIYVIDSVLIPQFR
jgi:uncharacterized surface protein with fasciclin (FAS1) repeats